MGVFCSWIAFIIGSISSKWFFYPLSDCDSDILCGLTYGYTEFCDSPWYVSSFITSSLFIRPPTNIGSLDPLFLYNLQICKRVFINTIFKVHSAYFIQFELSKLTILIFRSNFWWLWIYLFLAYFISYQPNLILTTLFWFDLLNFIFQFMYDCNDKFIGFCLYMELNLAFIYNHHLKSKFGICHLTAGSHGSSPSSK